MQGNSVENLSILLNSLLSLQSIPLGLWRNASRVVSSYFPQFIPLEIWEGCWWSGGERAKHIFTYGINWPMTLILTILSKLKNLARKPVQFLYPRIKKELNICTWYKLFLLFLFLLNINIYKQYVLLLDWQVFIILWYICRSIFWYLDLMKNGHFH